jgi:hypothetical protein
VKVVWSGVKMAARARTPVHTSKYLLVLVGW